MTEPLPGVRFDRFTVQSVLGRGGMGVVYAATDHARGSDVALKCLALEQLANDKQRQRAIALFEREYYSLSELKHPHIIDVYDYDRAELGPYYTMELLRGTSLRERSPLSFREACRFIRDIASALALLHSRSLIHRDVSPRNIHCTAAGHAKLIDFGAMMPNGVARHVIGTPAFTPPECLQQESLDGQTDLYALGCCLYYAITGQYAYPARTLDELRSIWQTPVRPPSELVPEVPAALDDLVLSLLSLNPSDRPRTAADVYERLTSIAGLPQQEAHGTAQAYLTKPSLIGRSASVELLREHAQRAARGRGASLFVRGERGVGRSRLLDVAALESKLSGLTVARADASVGHFRSLGAVSALLDALTPENPALHGAVQALQLPLLLEAGRRDGLDAEQRERVLRELTGALLEACKQRPCALIVDDVHAIDEPSVALLAGLAAQAQEWPLLLVSSADEDVRLAPGSAYALLGDYSRRVELGALDAAQNRQLVSAMLGDVPKVDVLSAITYGRCQGNPQSLMEVMRSLIERGCLRYLGGSWVIHPSPDALARAIADEPGQAQRLARLSEDARELLQAIAIDRYELLTWASYSGFSSHGDPARLHRALFELVAERWVTLREDEARLKREDLRQIVLSDVSTAQRRRLHELMAERCAALGLAPIFEAHYRLGAEQPLAAIVASDAFDLFVQQHPTADVVRHPVTLEVSDALSRLPQIAGAAATMHAKYLAIAMLNATYRGLPQLAAECLPRALASIAPFSGVADYAALTQLPAADRLHEALSRAAARCATADAGAMDFISSLRRQAQLCVTSAVVANFMVDVELLDLIPDLRPFQVLSPALAIAVRVVDALSYFLRGQTWLAWDALLAARTALQSSEADAIDGLTRLALSRTILGYLCALHAEHGSSGSLALIDEYAIHMPDVAESHRSRYYLARGDLSGAASARRRFEVLSVRMGSVADMRVVELPTHLTLYSACADVLGLRRTLLALEDVAKTRPGWQTRARLAEVQLARCQGQITQGLAASESLLAGLEPPHSDWQEATAARLSLLMAAGEAATAAELGRDYVVRAESVRLPTFRIELSLIPALCALERHDEAEQHYASALAQLEARSASGVLAGALHEVGARLALARGDDACFSERASACAEQFRLGQHPALAARYNALMRDAKRLGERLSLRAPVPSDERLQMLRRLSRDPDVSSFYRAVLNLLLKGAGAVGGILYVRGRERVERVALVGELARRADLDAIPAYYFGVPGDSDSEGTTQSSPERQGLGIYVLRCGDRVEAVAVLDVGSALPAHIPDTSELAALLAEHSAARSGERSGAA